MTKRVVALITTRMVIGILLLTARTSFAQTLSALPIQEGFEDASLGARGWYDTTGAPLSTTEKYAGTRSLECHFLVGATGCAGGVPGRHQFQATDSIYISFYIKHSANWVGSGKPYHPHMFYFMTNLDGAYIGPAYTHLAAYVEENGGTPLLAIQDGMNIDETRVGQDLTSLTENRAVAGCNGDSDGYGNGECYLSGSLHWNSKKWYAGGVYFDNTSGGPRYKANWHLVEAYFRLNSIVNGKGAKDGVIRYWYDGVPIIDHSNVVLRTGAHSTMRFNQLLIAPYIGDGSPADQSYWIDNLVIASARPAVPPPPGGGTTAPQPPTNLRIIR